MNDGFYMGEWSVRPMKGGVQATVTATSYDALITTLKDLVESLEAKRECTR